MDMYVCIIGAGVSGLAAIKSCIEENITPKCFERYDHVGGLWNYTEEIDLNRASIAESTFLNISKEFMSYSDYPIKSELPNYMRHWQMQDYLISYTNAFGLSKYILFQHEVLQIEKADNYDITGRWRVSVRNIRSHNTYCATFDKVIVTSGRLSVPHYPSIRGVETFSGTMMHARNYRTIHSIPDLRNFNVLVIGSANTGTEVATDICNYARQVYVSSRAGTWLHERRDANGLPRDIVDNSRWNHFIKRNLGHYISSRRIMKKLSRNLDHELYGLSPNHSPMQQHTVVNDNLAHAILCGTIRMKCGIAMIEKKCVTFTDDTRVEHIDAIIFATGYDVYFDFLLDELLQFKDNEMPLYRFILPPHLPHASLAFIGFTNASGPVVAMSEMQARWIARLYKKKFSLPSTKQMAREIALKRSEMKRTFTSSERYTVQSDFLTMMDSLAFDIGCRPPFWLMLISDPKLFVEVYLGPYTPYQFRLCGPGAWKGAKHAIMTQWERIVHPLNTNASTSGHFRKKVRDRIVGSRLGHIKCVCVIVTFVLLYLCWYMMHL